jgi:hypothetical protein
MKNYKLNIFLFILLTSIIYLACRKIDHQIEKQDQPAFNTKYLSETEGKFFNSHQSDNVFIQTLAGYVRRKNSKTNWLPSLG